MIVNQEFYRQLAEWMYEHKNLHPKDDAWYIEIEYASDFIRYMWNPMKFKKPEEI
jgi:hypothetical protein